MTHAPLATVLRQLHATAGAPAPAGESDRELLRRFLDRRQEDAFVALLRRHGPMVLRVGRRVGGNGHDAEDVFQATFLLLARKAAAIRKQESVGSWLHGVALRLAREARAQATRRQARERRAADMRKTTNAADSAWQELQETLDGALEALPERYRAPLLLCYLEGKTQEEAARQLGCPLGTVRSRLARGRDRLKVLLERSGVRLSATALAAALAGEAASAAVPAPLLNATARAALACAAGTAPEALVSERAAALFGRALRTAALARFRAATAVLLAAGVIGVGVTLVGPRLAAGPPEAAAEADPPDAAPQGKRASRGEPAKDPAPSGDRVLSGRVVGPDGAPVGGARVRAETWNDTPLAETRTDADGVFRLRPAAAAYRYRYDLTVQAPGFACQYVPGESYSFFPGREGSVGTIRLARGRVFTGRVLDADGKPRPGADVRCRVNRYSMGHSVAYTGPEEVLKPDADGRFRTPPLPVGHLDLRVRVPGRRLGYVLKPIRPGGEEDLGDVRLEPDVPVTGILQDDEGRPVAGADVRASGDVQTTSDAEGNFVLRGFGPDPEFQLQVWKQGYLPVNRAVHGSAEGLRWRDVGGGGRSSAPEKGLTVVMTRAARIEGRAVDAETGTPVRPDRVVLCLVERRDGGKVVLQGCRAENFEASADGTFRISYSAPGEYHLAVSAAGYDDAEAFTPRVSRPQPIRGITVRMSKQMKEGAKSAVARQRLAGTVTRDGKPVASGWVGLWGAPRTWNAINSPVLRGRTVVGPPTVMGSAPIKDGAYALDVPQPGAEWYLVAEEPGRAPTRVGPFRVGVGEEKTVDIACAAGGGIRGRVKGVPAGWEGQVWVVAFTKGGVRTESRVEPDGRFTLGPLPAGEYGLKTGHDAYTDPEIPRWTPGKDFSPEDWAKKADPWKRSKAVKVESGRDAEGVEVEFPR